ncbi:MAG: thioredoxin fold domain-containing protein [Phormidium tanganyikae FI6-MK23]|jgi:thioredoxin 1|nr:thioredoxin fold domain-containing protein [Phormidium tanganyikae FI6-MK23]
MQAGISEGAFRQEVLKSDTLVLVHFWAPWCGICRLIEPSLNLLLNEYGDRLKLVGVNADENLKLANQYRITTLPTVLLFEGGQVLHRLDTYQRREELRSILQEILVAPVSAAMVKRL